MKEGGPQRYGDGVRNPTSVRLRVDPLEPAHLEDDRIRLVAEQEITRTVLNHWRPVALQGFATPVVKLFRADRIVVLAGKGIDVIVGEVRRNALNEEITGLVDFLLSFAVGVCGVPPPRRIKAMVVLG